MNILKTNKCTQNSIWELLLDYTLLIKKKRSMPLKAEVEKFIQR